MIASNRKGPLCMFAASICWSFGGLLIKLIPWGALSIIGLRSVLAALVFIIWRRSAKIDFTKGNVLAALCLSGAIILFVFANKLTTAAAAILLQFTAPIFIILIELVCYRKKPTRASLIAVAVTLSGMLLFFADRLDAGNMLGNLLAIASGLSFAGVFVCNKRTDVISEHSLLLGFLICSAIGLPYACFDVTADKLAWASVSVLGIVQVGLAYVFFSIGIKITPALLACLVTALEPVLNPLWVALVTEEIPGPFSIAGGAVVVSTVVAYNIWMEKFSAEHER